MHDFSAGHVIVLPRDEAKSFFGQKEDATRLEFLADLLKRDGTIQASLDGKWKACHEAFASIENAQGLEHCLLGGRDLHQGEDYHVCLVRPDIVRSLASELSGVQTDDSVAEFLPQIAQLASVYEAAAKVGGAIVFVAQK